MTSICDYGKIYGVKIQLILLFFFSLFIHSDYILENPNQTINSEDKSSFVVSDSIFLACEETSEQTVKDLLEGKIKLELNKKQKRAIKNGFNNDVRYETNKQKMLDGKSQLPIKYVLVSNFAAIKISKFSDSENRVEFCTSYNKNLNGFNDCKYFEKKNNAYEYFYQIAVFSGSAFSQTTNNEILNRETLKYQNLEDKKSTYSNRSNNRRYQCHLSDEEEINTLHTNFNNLLIPLQSEWDNYIKELIDKEKEIKSKNII
jgi:hypothetical protein